MPCPAWFAAVVLAAAQPAPARPLPPEPQAARPIPGGPLLRPDFHMVIFGPYGVPLKIAEETLVVQERRIPALEATWTLKSGAHLHVVAADYRDVGPLAMDRLVEVYVGGDPLLAEPHGVASPRGEAREFTLRRDGRVVRTRLVVVGSRVYVLDSVSDPSGQLSPETEAFFGRAEFLP